MKRPVRMVAVLLRVHFFPGLCLLILGLGLQFPVIRWLLNSYSQRSLIWLGSAASTALLVAGYLLEFQRVLRHLPVAWWTWLECASLVERMWLIGLAMGLLGLHRTPQFDPARRKLMQVAGAGLCIAPLAATAFGIVRRNHFRVTEVQVPIPN